MFQVIPSGKVITTLQIIIMGDWIQLRADTTITRKSIIFDCDESMDIDLP